MSDLNQILAGNVEDVTNAIGALTLDDLTRLKALEEADKNRKGVLAAISAAMASLAAAVFSGNETHDPAEPAKPEPAAVVPQSIDLLHPAVDANLRAGTTELQNRIDFNDPYMNGRDTVEAALTSTSEG